MSTQSREFDNRPARYVGRVGALAIALGIGTAILGFSGAAAADSGTSDRGAGGSAGTSGAGGAAGTTGAGSARRGDSGRATTTRAGDRRNAPNTEVSAPETGSDADSSNGRAVAPEQRALSPRAAAGSRDSRTRDHEPPSAGGLQSDPADIGSSTAPAQPTPFARVRSALPTPSARVQSALPNPPANSGPASSGGGEAPQAVPPQPVTAVAVTPVATATAAAAPAVTDGDARTLLGADGSGAPLLAPLAWATLAAARREDLTGTTPEVAPAAAEGTAELDAGLGAQINATGLSITSGAVGTQLTITGKNLGTTSAVKFGCSLNACEWGIAGEIVGKPSSENVQVIVPAGAPTGNVQVIATFAEQPANTISKQVFTVTGVLPSITDFTPGRGGLGSQVTITGENFTDAVFVQFGSGQQTSLAVNQTGTEITVAVPGNATTGQIVVGLPTGGAVSATTFTIPLAPLPALSTCTDSGGNYCGTVALAQVMGINALSAAVAATIPSAGPAGKCTKDGCPTLGDLRTPSVANTIGEYAFNIVYSLSGAKTSDAAIGQTIVDLVTQQNVLAFISQTVAGNQALAQLPPAVATTIGDAVATFVSNSFGNLAVATAFAPFLRDLNLPTGLNLPFVDGLKTDPLKTILNRFTPAQQQKGQITLQNSFFGNTDVQLLLGRAFADSVGDLVGSPAITGYLGQVAASALLGQPVEATNPLAVTIGGAIQALFTNIGGIVASDAGTAFQTLLRTPALDGQPAVATTLANVVVNQVVTTLGGTAPFAFQDGLLPALAPGAGVAVTGFVNELLSDPTVDQALGIFVTQLTTGVLGNPVGQQLVSQGVADAVSGFLGDGPLGQAVGNRVGAAAATLVASPAVSGALATLVNSVFGAVLGAPGVATALADAAGGLTSAVLDGEAIGAAVNTALAALRANPDVVAAVGPAVTTAVGQFLGDTGLRSAVDAAIASLITGLINDPAVQQALTDEVTDEITTLLGADLGPELGPVVGPQVGATVVALLTNPTVSGALVELVDTVLGDFISAPGVISALAGAAGQLATAAVQETLPTVAPAVGAALRANPDVDAAIQGSVVTAVQQFLGNTEVWSLVDDSITGLVATVIADPPVQQALNTGVTNAVSNLLHGGELGQVVGAQVAATVLQLVNDPTVGTALLAVFDTVFTDLFGAPGVIDAFAGAAGDLALAALTLPSADFTDAVKGIVAGLRVNPAVDAGVQTSVTDAVAQFLNDTAVWTVVDGAVASLLGEVLADTAVQQALSTRLTNEISTALGGGDLGQVVGGQVATVVLGLLTDPVVTNALVDVVDSVLTDFFGADGVVDAIAGAAGDVALAVLVFESPAAAVRDALSALRANTAIQAGVLGTVADALGVIDTEVLSNAAFQQTLGTAITGLINELAADQVVQTFVTGQFGAAVGGLLADTAVVGEVASAVGTAVTQLLGSPGVSTAVTNAAAQFIDAVLEGTATTEAAQAALAALRSDPSVVAAVNSVIPPIVNSVLDTADVRQAIGVVVEATTLATLGQTWPNIPFLDNIIARVVRATAEDFLTRPAGQKLVDGLVVDLVLGTPVTEIEAIVVREVVRSPALQIALGFSLGVGIGSLFGDNIFGDIIGFAAGFPATLVVSVAATVIGIYQWIVGGLLSVFDAFAAPAQSTEIPYVGSFRPVLVS